MRDEKFASGLELLAFCPENSTRGLELATCGYCAPGPCECRAGAGEEEPVVEEDALMVGRGKREEDAWGLVAGHAEGGCWSGGTPGSARARISRDQAWSLSLWRTVVRASSRSLRACSLYCRERAFTTRN